MSSEENKSELNSDGESETPEVFRAEVVDSNTQSANDSSSNQSSGDLEESTPTESDGQLADSTTNSGLAEVLETANESDFGSHSGQSETLVDAEMVGPQSHIWEQNEPSIGDRIGKRAPYEGHAIRAKVAYLVATLASLGLIFWFCYGEFQAGVTNSFVVIRSILLVLVAFLGGMTGFFRVQRKYVPMDARVAAVAIALAGIIGFLFSFSANWFWVSFAWMSVQFFPFVLNQFSPKRVGSGEVRFDVNDSIAANGGSVAALVLGIWSIFGALFTSLSLINGMIGIVLGIWGLTSRKKSLAVFGIVLCFVGIMACMLNITYFFWELILIEEDELMSGVQ